MTARYYSGDVQLQSGLEVALSAHESSHLIKSMRGAVGDRIIVFGAGRQFEADVVAIEGKTRAVIRVCEELPPTPPPSIELTVLVPWIKGGKTELVVQKLTELGVARMIVFQARREVARGDEGKIDRLKRIALEACKQCERTDLPCIEQGGTLVQALELCGEVPVSNRFLLHERLDGSTISAVAGQALVSHAAAVIAVGPEGGWHPDELDPVKDTMTPVSLGPRILRAETAPIVAVAALLTITGDI